MIQATLCKIQGFSYSLSDDFQGLQVYDLFVCLFDLILYFPSTIFQLIRDGSSWVEPVLSYDKCVLLKDQNTVTPVKLKPAAPLSPVKHSTTEPLRSLTHKFMKNTDLYIIILLQK